MRWSIALNPKSRRPTAIKTIATKKPAHRAKGYPAHGRVLRGASYIAQTKPEPVFMTVVAQLHNLREWQKAALLQVFKIMTLACAWILRDIEQRRPEQRFAKFRKRNSTKYYTDGIAAAIERDYRDHIRSRYTINSYLFGGLCRTLASNIAGYLRKLTEARQKGWLTKYQESASFVVKFGKHKGKALGTLGRKTIFGYAFLAPKRVEYEEALGFINLLLNNDTDDQELLEKAEGFRMSFGPRRGRLLGSLRPETLRRLKRIVDRDLVHADDLEELRQVAQTYLRFTPPGFWHMRSDGLSPNRRRQLDAAYIHALNGYAALPELEPDVLEGRNLTWNERELFAELQQRAYAATRQPHYVELRWNRADGCIRHRECALVYEPRKRRYLFLAYVLADGSHHKRVLHVNGDLVDVNNPTVKLASGRRPSTAMLFELEFDTHQQEILNQARRDAGRWKEEDGSSSGSVRAATLHAHYSKDRRTWWFEVHLSVGIKPTHIEQPEHVVGVHVDPLHGMFVTVLGLDGVQKAQFQLDEYCIATWLGNKEPELQAQLRPKQRTTKERHHRLADALVAICHHYHAQLGMENIAYRHTTPGPARSLAQDDSSRTVFGLLDYKLARLNLPKGIDIKGVSPKRDCGRCSHRHPEGQVQADIFACSVCKHSEPRHFNTSREIARRVLWVLANKQAPNAKRKKAEQSHTTSAR